MPCPDNGHAADRCGPTPAVPSCCSVGPRGEPNARALPTTRPFIEPRRVRFASLDAVQDVAISAGAHQLPHHHHAKTTPERSGAEARPLRGHRPRSRLLSRFPASPDRTRRRPFRRGSTWAESWTHFSNCSGGTAANGGDYGRASDPWVTFAPNGDAYQISLSASTGLTVSAVLVSKKQVDQRR